MCHKQNAECKLNFHAKRTSIYFSFFRLFFLNFHSYTFVVVVDITSEAIAKRTSFVAGNLRNHLNHISQMRKFFRALKAPFKWMYRSWMLWLLLLEATFSLFTFHIHSIRYFSFWSITHFTLIHCYTSNTMYCDKHICMYFCVCLVR